MTQRTIPDNPRDRLEFFETHLDQWRDHAAALQLSAADLDGLEQQILHARTALEQNVALHNAARAATVNWRSAEAQMTDRGRSIVRSIRALAAAQPTDALYILAHLPPPAEANSQPQPPRPVSNVRVDLITSATYVINWSGELDGRTYFVIERSLIRPLTPGRSFNEPYSFLATAQQRSHTDTTVPPAIAGVQYRVTPLRGPIRGSSATGLLMLGTPSPPKVISTEGASTVARPAAAA